MWRSAHRVPATPQRQTRRGNLSVVVGVLVGQHDFRGGPDLAGLTAMHALYPRRPFPPLVSKVEPKPPDTLRRSTGQRPPDGGCAHVVDRILGHGTKNIPSTGHFVRAWSAIRTWAPQEPDSSQTVADIRFRIASAFAWPPSSP